LGPLVSDGVVLEDAWRFHSELLFWRWSGNSPWSPWSIIHRYKMVLYSASTTEVCYARIFCLRNWSSFICLGPGKCVVQDSLSVSEAKLEDGDVLMAGASEQPEQRYPASIL
jgi:hypothetical protein